MNTRRANSGFRRPDFREGLLFSTGGFIFLFAALFLFGTSSVLTCTYDGSSSLRCDLQTSTFGMRFRTTAIEGLTAAKLHQINASGENAWVVVLQTNEGEIPFSDFSSLGYSEKKVLADQLNGFLEGQSPLKLEVSSRTQSLYNTLIGILFSIIGAASLAYGLRVFGF